MSASGGIEEDQLQEVRIIVQTRSEVNGVHLGRATAGGAVALMVELMSCHPSLLGNAINSIVAHGVCGHGNMDKPCEH